MVSYADKPILELTIDEWEQFLANDPGDGGQCRIGAVDQRAGRKDDRAETPPRIDVIAKLPDVRQRHVATHVADAGDAIGDQQGKVGLGPALAQQVDVHVPETRDQVLALAVDAADEFGSDCRGTADAGDAVAFDQHRHVGLWRRAAAVNQRHVCNLEC